MKKILLLALVLLGTVDLFAQMPLKIGDKAPLFTGKDNNGKSIELKDILKTHKSAVVFFYRGEWCPFCNKHIKNLQDSLQTLTDKGAYVIGISPERATGVAKTVAKTKAAFSIISDFDYRIMKAYQVNYVMESGLADRYKKGGLDIAAANGQTDYVLPVPATYIIGKDGRIKFVYFDKDYKKRPSVKSLAEAL